LKALILAAGFGTRLGNLTKKTPKPLIDLNGKPVLETCLEKLDALGVSEFIVNTHHLREKFEVYKEISPYRHKIKLSHESVLLGPLGTLRTHIDQLAESDFFVMHADNFFHDPLGRMLREHRESPPKILTTVATFESKEPEKCGVFETNASGDILEFYEKVENPSSNIANAAIYIFKPDIKILIEELDSGLCDISKDLIPRILSNCALSPLEGHFIDMGTPKNLATAKLLAGESL